MQPCVTLIRHHGVYTGLDATWLWNECECALVVSISSTWGTLGCTVWPLHKTLLIPRPCNQGNTACRACMLTPGQRKKCSFRQSNQCFQVCIMYLNISLSFDKADLWGCDCLSVAEACLQWQMETVWHVWIGSTGFDRRSFLYKTTWSTSDNDAHGNIKGIPLHLWRSHDATGIHETDH